MFGIPWNITPVPEVCIHMAGMRSFPGQSLSRTRRYPDRRFPVKTFFFCNFSWQTICYTWTVQLSKLLLILLMVQCRGAGGGNRKPRFGSGVARVSSILHAGANIWWGVPSLCERSERQNYLGCVPHSGGSKLPINCTQNSSFGSSRHPLYPEPGQLPPLILPSLCHWTDGQDTTAYADIDATFWRQNMSITTWNSQFCPYFDKEV